MDVRNLPGVTGNSNYDDEAAAVFISRDRNVFLGRGSLMILVVSARSGT